MFENSDYHLSHFEIAGAKRISQHLSLACFFPTVARSEVIRQLVFGIVYEPMSDYQRDWQEYKRLRNRFWLVVASYMPVCGIVAFVSIRVFHTSTPAFVVAFFWMGLFMLTGNRVCRCGDVLVAESGSQRPGGTT